MSKNPLAEDASPPNTDLDLVQISEAWAHIAKGEKTAQALESNLTSLEKKIDDLLASFEDSERQMLDEANSKAEASKSRSDGDGNTKKL